MSNKIVVLNIKSNQFLSGYKAADENIVHLTETGGGVEKLAEGVALAVFNKNVGKKERLPAETADAAARKELKALIAGNAAELLVELPTQKKETGAGKSSASKAKAKKKGDAKPKGEGRRGRAPTIPPEAKIKVLVAENPKRKGSESFKRFELYSKSANVGEYLKKGGRTPDLAWDIEHEFIKVA